MESLTKDAISKIEELVEAASKNNTFSIGGQDYFVRSNNLVCAPVAQPLKVKTLKSVVDYIASEHPENGTIKVVVEEFNCVKVFGLLNNQQKRDEFIVATIGVTTFQFGNWYPPDEFVIKLQSCFDDTDDKRKTLAVVGNIKEEEVIEREDDGISQQVRAGSGITTVKDEKLPNPVKLQPFRTFHEITQPITPFILRAKKTNDGLRLALFEADGLGWQTDAIDKIKDYLTKALPKATVI